MAGEVVHHIDGDKTNNHPDNLQVLTKAQHAAIHRKELNAAIRLKMAKLSEWDVVEIRILSASGIGDSLIAKGFGVSTRAIRSVVMRESWRHVE